MHVPGMGQGVPRLRLVPSFWSSLGHSVSVMALAGMLFSMVMRTGHPEGNSSNWCPGAVWGTFLNLITTLLQLPLQPSLFLLVETMTHGCFPSHRFWLLLTTFSPTFHIIVLLFYLSCIISFCTRILAPQGQDFFCSFCFVLLSFCFVHQCISCTYYRVWP